MTAEQVFRALILKQMMGFSYRELRFHLADSQTYRTFCRLGFSQKLPSKSVLSGNIKRLRAETLEEINRLLVKSACDQGIEKGSKVRVDCTVVETNIHPPSDSQQLYPRADPIDGASPGLPAGRNLRFLRPEEASQAPLP